MTDEREIVCKGGQLGQFKVIHNTGNNTYRFVIDDIVREHKAIFNAKEFEFIMYALYNYKKSQEPNPE